MAGNYPAMKKQSFPRQVPSYLILLSSLLLLPYSLFPQRVYPESLFSRAEKTHFEETTLSKEVVAFVNELEARSDLVSVETFGHSLSGQPLQLVIMANPRMSTPEEAKASGKVVVYIQGNIHGGEVEGKEAAMTLMRQIAFENQKYLLDNQIILFCPNFNPDGNDQLSDNSRRNQDGSPKLTGERASGEGFDLNREGLKLEALEAKALVKNVLNRWDPALLVDLHTDNGSWHGYSVNYAPAFQSVGSAAPTKYTMENILPWARQDILDRTGMETWWHGYFRMREGEKGIFTAYSHQPHYLTNYVGLRNRMGILSETFAHQLFEKRYWATYLLVEAILKYTNAHATEINQMIAQADEETIQLIKNQAGKMQKGVRFALTKQPESVSILVRETMNSEDENGRRRIRGTGKITWADSVLLFNSFEPTLLSTVPKAYYFPKEFSAIADKLREHGIRVEDLQQKEGVSGEFFTIKEYKKDTRSRFPGHVPVSLEGTFSTGKRNFKSGDYKVSLEQPLAWLVFYLLEPQSDDGLVYWNFFDSYLESKKAGEKPVDFPVFKSY